MTSVLTGVLVAQWAAILGLLVGLLGLARQIGVLHQRLGPAGALMLSKGAKVGEASPSFRLESLEGGMVPIGEPAADGRSTLLMFVSPDCQVCGSLLPVAKSIARSDPSLRLVFASDGDLEKQRRFRTEKGLDNYPYVLSRELGMAFEIGRLPYAVLIASDGVVAAQGLVNTREHIESLLEAHRMGVASIQDFLADAPISEPATFSIRRR
ncbi:methylamine dehydrogenase accessory protein MauD [Phenylobacterium sp.]|uniref:methylamine dehydrogenase accessory protein MauD n=1 Tax=Phenylobacterium sp. TaxID=1871053 RepID=UPI0030F4891E